MQTGRRTYSRAGVPFRLRGAALVFVLALALLHVGLHHAAIAGHAHFGDAGTADCQLAKISAAALPEISAPVPALPCARRDEAAESQVFARYTDASWSPRAPPV